MRDSVLNPRFLRLAAIIGVGILSRLSHTGLILIDKYLGDALYAAMFYELLRLPWSAVAMVAIESFQLTGIPAHLLASDYLPVRLCARLLGTEFSWLDLLAYAAGIWASYFADSRRAQRPSSS